MVVRSMHRGEWECSERIILNCVLRVPLLEGYSSWGEEMRERGWGGETLIISSKRETGRTAKNSAKKVKE